jgi:DNA-binding winged helix-turn-helix (wHTH) protein/TolB-like protein/Tfp pilus assembly protein PilF
LRVRLISSEKRSIIAQLFLKAAMSNPVNQFYEIGPFRIDVANRLLLRDGAPLPLTPKAVDTLLALVQHNGQVLNKEELMKLVWPDSVVEEGNLTQNIYLLRKTLSEGSNGRNYIETIPRRGYRFVGDAHEAREEAAAPLPAEQTEVQAVIEEKKTNEWLKESEGAMGQKPMAPLRPSAPSLLRHFTTPLRLTGLAAVAIAIIAGLSYLLFFSRPKPPELKATIESIAVLPFKPLSAEGDSEDLGIGLADAVITRLSNHRQIIVRPTSAVLKYNNLNQDLLAVGRELNVDALLDSRFQRAGENLRVTAQLVSVRDGTPLWADKFDVAGVNPLAAQDAIAESVTRALALKLSGEGQKLLSKRLTTNAEAHQAYLSGLDAWKRRATPALEEAIEHYEQAIRRDPEYAQAHAALANAYALLSFRYDTQESKQSEAFPKAKAAAVRALQLNELSAEAHTALAVVKQRYDWDWTGAEKEFKRALELNPNDAPAREMYALYLAAVGRLKESKTEINRALELDSLSLQINRGLGEILYFAREYEQAIEQLRRTLKMDPDDQQAFAAHRLLGWIYLHRGLPDRALEEFIEALRLQRADSTWLSTLRQAYAAAGMQGYWRKWLEMHQSRIQRGRLNPFYLAQIYAFLGETEQAFAYLGKAYEDRSVRPAVLQFNPNFDCLRDDPKYEALRRRLALAP